MRANNGSLGLTVLSDNRKAISHVFRRRLWSTNTEPFDRCHERIMTSPLSVMRLHVITGKRKVDAADDWVLKVALHTRFSSSIGADSSALSKENLAPNLSQLTFSKCRFTRAPLRSRSCPSLVGRYFILSLFNRTRVVVVSRCQCMILTSSFTKKRISDLLMSYFQICCWLILRAIFFPCPDFSP